MSRIGRKPINIPAGVTVTIDANVVTVKGPKGTLTQAFHPNMSIKTEGNEILVTRPNDEKENRALHGLTRTLVNNIVLGVTEGFTKKLEIVGTGYRVVAKGTDLEFALGFSHPVVVKAPEGITFAVESPTKFSVSGISKQQVGHVAAKIRGIRPPEPYKGKGVRYADEVVLRKAGKAGK